MLPCYCYIRAVPNNAILGILWVTHTRVNVQPPDDNVLPWARFQSGGKLPNASNSFCIPYRRRSGNTVSKQSEQLGSTSVERGWGKRGGKRMQSVAALLRRPLFGGIESS